MATKQSANVGLNHPTVVPEGPADHDENQSVRCPACGRPLASH